MEYRGNLRSNKIYLGKETEWRKRVSRKYLDAEGLQIPWDFTGIIGNLYIQLLNAVSGLCKRRCMNAGVPQLHMNLAP